MADRLFKTEGKKPCITISIEPSWAERFSIACIKRQVSKSEILSEFVKKYVLKTEEDLGKDE